MADMTIDFDTWLRTTGRGREYDQWARRAIPVMDEMDRRTRIVADALAADNRILLGRALAADPLYVKASTPGIAEPYHSFRSLSVIPITLGTVMGMYWLFGSLMRILSSRPDPTLPAIGVLTIASFAIACVIPVIDRRKRLEHERTHMTREGAAQAIRDVTDHYMRTLDSRTPDPLLLWAGDAGVVARTLIGRRLDHPYSSEPYPDPTIPNYADPMLIPARYPYARQAVSMLINEKGY